MNLNPKTDHLTPWQSGQPSPNPMGRRPKFVTTLKKMGYAKSEINEVILVMLAMTEKELIEIISRDDTNILELTICKALLLNAKRGSLNALEVLLNRSIGLPVRQTEVQLKHEEYTVTLNL
jgi:hypothetical protein